MKRIHNRALKEWAIACRAMERGETTLLLRKGGIREEGGAFHLEDREFFLMPTYDHQNEERLKPAYRAELKAMQAFPAPRETLTLSLYAAVESVVPLYDEAHLERIAEEYPWNDAFVKERFDFNPYSPLFLVLLRVYRLYAPVEIPLLPEYGGCKSWVTFAVPLSLEKAVPAISDEEFPQRRAKVLRKFASFLQF